MPSHFQIRSYGPEFSLELLAISLLPYGSCFFHCRLKVSIVKVKQENLDMYLWSMAQNHQLLHKISPIASLALIEVNYLNLKHNNYLEEMFFMQLSANKFGIFDKHEAVSSCTMCLKYRQQNTI